MENFDAEKATRVWQRVKGVVPAPPALQESPRELLHQSQALAGLYLGLQRQLKGQAAGRARELYRQHWELTACLKGMCLTAGEAVPGLGPAIPGTGTARSILEGCFHRERRLGDALASRAGPGGLGPVWQLLTGQAVKRAAAVLALLGETEDPRI